MFILGIETSCDETAAAVLEGSQKQILSHVIYSQIQEHIPYGGVVPELAARSHLIHLEPVVKEALARAGLSLNQIDAFAVTAGPGLIGGVTVGVMMAKAFAAVQEKPFLAVNHLEGHILTARLVEDISFPFLVLLISGGHCQFIHAKGVGDYRMLGETLDDAVGEAFDKVAQMLGLSYPGGPAIEALAIQGNPHRFPLPHPLKGRKSCELSFSGLKTAVRHQIQSPTWSPQDAPDLAASFQYTVAQILTERLEMCIRLHGQSIPRIVIAGGVAANQCLKTSFENLAKSHGKSLTIPPVALCTDNAAMIAWAGYERLHLGLIDDLSFAPRPRWPLEER